jgi:hypothetical protein
MQVVRKAVKDGTLHKLMGTSRSQGSTGGEGSRKKAPSAAVTNPMPQPAPAGSVTCALCMRPQAPSNIAMTVAGEAFCGTCDHYRRRANNLGLQTREVTSAFRSGSLASVLGMSEQELARQIGAVGMHGNGASAREVGGQKRSAGPAKAGQKVVTLGRLCRMCRQVRAPVVGMLLHVW